MARIGNQKHFQANRNSPVFEELLGIARKILPDVGSNRPLHSGHLTVPAARSPGAAYEVTPDSELDVSKATLARLCRKYGFRKLSLFGSAARRTMNSTSDVDLLVEFAPESRTSLFDFPSMQRDFSEAFGHRVVLAPLVLAPEPRADSYSRSHPRSSEVLLVIEVSDTTLGFDVRTKVPLYARCGIPEVWIVDVQARAMMVFRGPGSQGYGTDFKASMEDEVAAAGIPDVRFHVRELFLG